MIYLTPMKSTFTAGIPELPQPFLFCTIAMLAVAELPRAKAMKRLERQQFAVRSEDDRFLVLLSHNIGRVMWDVTQDVVLLMKIHAG